MDLPHSSLAEDLDVDAVVVGAGPNGLVAACVLAAAGWDVCVLERNPVPGGAVASVHRPAGYVADLFSAFYPLAVASPAIAALGLHEHGLRWRRAPRPLAHIPAAGAPDAVVIHADAERTAAALDRDAPGDGATWLRLVEQWRRVREPVLEALFTPFPPVRGPVHLLARLGTPDALRLARMLTLPVHRLGAELFRGGHAPLLLAGNAMHSDIPAVAAGSGAFGWVLTMLAQDVGYPVPEGGAGALAAALTRRAMAAGARVHVSSPVERVVVRAGRALGVVTAGGQRVRARRAVLADVAVPALYGGLVPAGQLPARLLDDLHRGFEWDLPTVKVNWALSAKVPWRAAGAAGAGTIHLGADLQGLAAWSAALSAGRASPHTFQIVGQLATADPTRAPDGAESLWAYGHLPRGSTDPAQARRLADALQAGLEAHAPGFGDLVVERWDQLPADLQEGDPNLVGGAINAGTAQPHQQLLFRPTPGLGRPETPIRGLYLAGAGAPPGGGVHGACGAIAARAAIAGARAGGLPGRVLAAATRRVIG